MPADLGGASPLENKNSFRLLFLIVRFYIFCLDSIIHFLNFQIGNDLHSMYILHIISFKHWFILTLGVIYLSYPSFLLICPSLLRLALGMFPSPSILSPVLLIFSLLCVLLIYIDPWTCRHTRAIPRAGTCKLPLSGLLWSSLGSSG